MDLVRTPRLIFRRPTRADAPEILRRYSSDPDVTQYLGWPRHRSLADAEGFITFSDHEWTTKPSGPLLIERRDAGVLIGSTGLMWDGPASAHVGYVLAKDAWGQGFATEALGAMVAAAHASGVTRLAAQCHPAHRASARVLEKQGFRLNARFVPAMFPNLAAGKQDSLLFVRPPDVHLEHLVDRDHDDVQQCAVMMATSEAWIRLKRTADALIPVLGDRDKELFVVRDGRGIAGFALLDLRGLLNGYVQTLCVREDRRSAGLGSALLTAVECLILDQSPNVFLCVSSFNTAAQRFYARLGYEHIGVMRDLVVAGADEILLRKTTRSLR